MSEPSQDRLASLDAFHGLTIAAMILVNNAGGRWMDRRGIYLKV